MNNPVHVSFLQSLLGRNLRIHTTDTRMFVGIFKCTDMDRNVILANTFEYRLPSQTAVQKAAAESASSHSSSSDAGKCKMDMTSRFIGLVVVPGQHITKIEVEENPFEIRTRPLPVTH